MMKKKHAIIVGCLIILCLGWMAFTPSEKSQTGTEKYAFLVVEYDLDDFGFTTKELVFYTIVEGLEQNEKIKSTTKELYGEMNKRMNSLTEKGYSLVDTDELVIAFGQSNAGKTKLKKTLIFKKVD